MTLTIASGGTLSIAQGGVMTGTAVPSAEPTLVGASFTQKKTFLGGSNTTGISWKDDGLRFFHVRNSDNTLRQTDCSSPYVLPSNINGTSQASGLSGNLFSCFMKPDGTSLFVTIRDGGNAFVREFTLSTAWDITSASLDGSNLLELVGVTFNPGLFFNSAGTLLIWTDIVSDTVNKWTLSTPWDLTTATATQSTNIFSTFSIDAPFDSWFSPSGLTMFTGFNNSYDPFDLPAKTSIAEFSLSSAYDLSTLSLVTNGFTSSHFVRSVTVANNTLWGINEVHGELYEIALP